MTARRRIALATTVTVAFLLLILAVLPLLFRARIAARVKAGVASRLHAQVDWGRVGINMFSDFPNVTFGLQDVVVAGVDRFAGDTLLTAERFSVVLDLGSVLRVARGGGPLVVRSVQVDEPTARLQVLEDGTASWDIVRQAEDAQDTTRRAFALSLRELAVQDARIVFDDRRAGVFASLAGVDESLRGDFLHDRFILETHTRADSVTLRVGGVPYLSRVALEARADIDADMVAGRFTLDDNELRLNQLVLHLAGTVARAGENLDLELAFGTPGSGFGEILSLVPAMYGSDFESLETSGTMTVSGRVRGEYGASAFPSFTLEAAVENGQFRYPDLPLPASDIALELAITNPGGHADSTVVQLSRFHAAVGGQPIDGSLLLRTPLSDPDLELRVSGRLLLSDLPRTIRLPNVEELSGVVHADFHTRARASDIERHAYDRVAASGTVEVNDLALRSAALPHPLRVEEARLTLSPGHTELAALHGTVGSSDVQATGRLENLLGFVLRREDLRGTASVQSAHFDLNEWRSEDETLEVIPVPPRLDVTLDADVARLTFGKLDIADAHGKLRIRDQRLTLDDFRMGLLDGTVAASGYYETTDVARPTFDVDVQLDAIDIPSAFALLGTVQRLAPVARYTQGRVSADVQLQGAMTADMMPVYEALAGAGTFATTTLVIEDFPAFGRIADALHVEQLRDPAVSALASSFEIRDGRMHVHPFDVTLGEARMHVSGSNGIDRSLDYALALELPRALVEAAGAGVLAGLASRGAQAGVHLQAEERLTLDVAVTGTLADPRVRLDLASTASQVGAGVEQALRAEMAGRRDAVEARVDTAAAAARRRVEEEATALLADAMRQADEIREEASVLAERMRAEGAARADSIEARADNSAARLAAKIAADRLRQESAASADRLIREADTRADALVAEARRRAEALRQNSRQ